MSNEFNTTIEDAIHNFCGEMKDSPLNGISGSCKIEKIQNDHMGGIDWESKLQMENQDNKKDGGKKERGKKEEKKDSKKDGKKENKDHRMSMHLRSKKDHQ